MKRTGSLRLRALVIAYVLIFVALPMAAAVPVLLREPAAVVWEKITMPQAVAAIKLSVYAASVAAAVNCILGAVVAWVVTRYRFVGRSLLDALIDLPFAIPGVVAAIAMMSLYGPLSTFGQWAGPSGSFGKTLAATGLPPFRLAGSFLGLVVANLFVTLPFVVRTVQPVIEELQEESEEAAESLGASTWDLFWRITLPQLIPGIVVGFGLAFARGVNEYGIVALISGNIPFKSQVGPVYIYQRLESFDYTAATAMAVVLTVISLGVLSLTYAWNRWRSRYAG